MTEIESGLESIREQWDRLPGESQKAYEAFQIYCDLAVNRKLATVARKLRKSAQLIHRWSVRHNWHVRCEAWDVAQDRQAQLALIEERASHNRAVIATAKKLHSDGLEALLALHAVRRVRVVDPVTGQVTEETRTALKAGEIVRMLEISHRLMNSVLGPADAQGPAEIRVLISGYDDDDGQELPESAGNA